jgi:hypothetical protein
MTGTPAHMGDLFLPDPEQWGLRGDPWVWAAMRDQLRDQPMPSTADQVGAILAKCFQELVGVDATQPSLPEDQQQVYREQFAHGGMSSGGVAVYMVA